MRPLGKSMRGLAGAGGAGPRAEGSVGGGWAGGEQAAPSRGGCFPQGAAGPEDLYAGGCGGC